MLTRAKTLRISTIALAVMAFGAVTPIQSASAQGLLDALFGGAFRSRAAPRDVPANASAFADPFGSLFGDNRRSAPSGEVSSGSGGGGGIAYCVRTCDGRFFPLQKHSSATPVELCKSFCPASKTAVFSGSKIDNAVSSNGARYADLDSAFVYREKVVDNCTCNGKDSFGLARLDVATDPTLRSGDIVATNEGFSTVKGQNQKTGAADFTPINKAALTGELRRQLAETKTTPALEKAEPITPVADETPPTARKFGRRHAAR